MKKSIAYWNKKARKPSFTNVEFKRLVAERKEREANEKNESDRV